MAQNFTPGIVISLVGIFVALMAINAILMQRSQSSFYPSSGSSKAVAVHSDENISPILLEVKDFKAPHLRTFQTDLEQGYFTRLLGSRSLLLGMQTFLQKEKAHTKLDDLLYIQSNPFRLLGLYKDLNPGQLYGPYHIHQKLGLAEDEYYCDAVDLLNVYNSDNWMKNISYASEFDSNKFLIEFLSSIYESPNAIINTPEFQKQVHASKKSGYMPEHLSENITFFFKKRQDFVFYTEIGLKHTCLTQAYGYIPNLNNICQKAQFPALLKKYDKLYNSRRECFSAENLFPKTYILSSRTDCNQFFDYIKSEQYQADKKIEPFQFLFKKGIGLHKGLGVSLLTEELEDTIMKDYQNGKKCGNKSEHNVVQKYIPNPLLLNRTNKFDFRVYALIVSTNPLIAFFREGLVRVSLRTYARNSTDVRVHLTNTYLSNDILKNITNEEEKEKAKQFQILQFPAFLQLLLDTGVVTDTNWIENYLKPKMKEAITHILRMGSKDWMKGSGLFRLTGFDFMLDENMKLWFIEANARPGINEDSSLQKFTMSKIGDMMEIVNALLHSRISRIQKFIKEFTKKHIIQRLPYDKNEMQKIFLEINKDKFEPGFPIRKGNTWEPIIDENLSGADAYFGIIREQCL